VIQGGSLTYTIGVHKDAFQASQYGTLSVHDLPTGATYSFPELSGNRVYKNNDLPVITTLIISTSANTPPGPHTFTVRLDFDDGRSYSDSAIIKIKEIPCPPFNVSISADPVQGKAPLEVQFKARVSEEGTSSDKELSGEYTYKWDFADGGTSDEKNPIHTFKNPDEYTVKLEVTNKCGQTKESEKKITVVMSCPPFSIEIKAEPEEGLVPLEVQFKTLIDEKGKGSYSYSWSFGDGSTSTEKDPLHTFNQAGIYNVILEVENECGSLKKAEKEIKVFSFEGIIGKSFSKTEALPGDEVLMTIQFQNDADVDFENVTIWDELSKYFVYIRDTAKVPHQWEGNRIIWDFATLRQGEKISFDVTLKVSENTPRTQIDNIAYLEHQTIGEPIASNKAVLKIRPAETKIEKSVNKTSAKPGEELNYRIRIKNDSPFPLTSVQVEDELSSHLDFISQDSPFTFSQQGGRLIWKGKIEAEEIAIIQFKAKAKETTFAGTRIANTVTFDAEEMVKSVTSNTVYTTISSEPISITQVRFSKRAEIPQAEVGRIIRYQLIIENRSNSLLLSPTIEDNLPQGFAYVPNTSLLNNIHFTDPQGSRRLFWTIPDIKPSETIILRYQVVIGADAKRGRNINRAILRARDSSGQDIMLEASEFINVSSLSFIFYSGVEGFVYIDRDGSGDYSNLDTPVENIEVRLSSGEKAYSDSAGHYLFETLYPGEYAVGLNTSTLPDTFLLTTPSPVAVVLPDGFTDMVNFGLKLAPIYQVKPCRLEGIVFFDKNGNETYEIDEPLLQDFKAMLDGKLITSGKQGRFVFSHIEEGHHSVEISYDNQLIKWDVELKTGKNKLYFPLRFSGIRVYIRREP
jgi:uncharacterized repeat protein (TIGR01451 family)